MALKGAWDLFGIGDIGDLLLNGGELNGVRILSRTTIPSIMGNQTGNLFGGGVNSYYGLAFGVVTKEGEARGGEGSG